MTTLAVFDQPAIKKASTAHGQLAAPNGTKERSIRTRAKNSPKLSPKVKQRNEPEEVNKVVNHESVQVVAAAMPSSKPFGSGMTGIPKPTAAVKGTAKIVKKASVANANAEEAAVLERTPGDGKEVSTLANKTTHFKLETVDNTSASDPTVTGNPSSQVAIAVKCSDTSPTHPDKSGFNRHIHSTTSIAEVEDQANQLDTTQPAAAAVENHDSQSVVSAVAKVLPMTTDSEKGVDVVELAVEDDEDDSMNVQPMTIFNNTSSLGKFHNESSTSAAVKRAANTSYADPLDGYLSEGGASLYARKLHYLAVTQRSSQNKDDDRSVSSFVSPNRLIG